MNLKDYFYYYYYKLYFFFYIQKHLIDKDTLLYIKAIKMNLYIGYSIIMVDLVCELINYFI